MSLAPRRHIAIIGGGASGVFLACHLLRDPDADVRVTLVERRPDVGRGIAYSTANPDHLLNVRAANMSAFPDQPGHFWDWLTAQKAARGGLAACEDPFCFVPRRVYGDYIQSLLAPLLSPDAGQRRLTIERNECVAIENGDRLYVRLADGHGFDADYAVLATGHEPPAPCKDCYANPWAPPAEAGITPDGTVLIRGTGLTMVDYVLTLTLGGHHGRIIALSRRGLLPRGHRPVDPVAIEATAVPINASVRDVLRWIRGLVTEQHRRGGDWRGVIDGMRPYNQRLWQGFSIAERRRFLEHARAWWDVHRHRMAPEVERRINAAIRDGQLSIVAGKIISVEPSNAGATVHYRRRGSDTIETMQVQKIVECMAVVATPPETENRVLCHLLDSGLAQRDPLGLGLDVTDDGAIIDSAGRPSERLYGIGPITRAAFWEITAVPDIRNQCARLAKHLIQHRPIPTRVAEMKRDSRLDPPGPP